MNDFWRDRRAARGQFGTAGEHRRDWRSVAGNVAWLGTAACLLGGCTMASNVHHRTSDEVRAAVVAQAASAPVQAAKAGAAEAETLEGLMTEVIAADHQYRQAVADVHLAGVQLTEAHRELLPRLLARGFFEMPINEGQVDTVFSGGLFLRFDLVRAFLYRNSVTVAEVTQEARREKCRAFAAAACQGFFSGMIQVDALERAMAHNQSARRLATQAAAEAGTLFKAGRLGADRWQTWEQRSAEMDLEEQRLAARLRQARTDANRSYRASVDESVLLRHTEAFLQRLAGNEKPPSVLTVDTLEDTLENTPGVVGAKLDLFLAEIGVIEARLKRLPSVSLAVGAGQIPVQGDRWRKESGIIPMAEISMPILDMGDISRGVERARLQAGQARERMIQAVETSRLTIESTGQKLAAAEAARAAGARLRDTAAVRRGEATTLRDAGRATVMDVHEAGWTLVMATAAADQAEWDCRQALLEERAARGLLLDGPLRQDVFSKLELRKKAR